MPQGVSGPAGKTSRRGRRAARRPAGRLSDRDRLRPGRGRDQRSRGRRDLRGQAAAALQSADRARREPRRGARARLLERAAERLAARFWPGPLTLVLPRAPGSPLSLLVSAGLRYGRPCACPRIRSPRRCSRRPLLPVAAPSANPAGRGQPDHGRARRGRRSGERIDVILDGGPCPIGLESTVVDLTGPAPRLLRPGGLVRSARSRPRSGRCAAAGPRRRGEARAQPGPAGQPLCPVPGRVRLDARTVAADEALLAFGPQPLGGAAHDPQSQPERRSRGGGRQSVRHAARAGPARTCGRSRSCRFRARVWARRSATGWPGPRRPRPRHRTAGISVARLANNGCASEYCIVD